MRGDGAGDTREGLRLVRHAERRTVLVDLPVGRGPMQLRGRAAWAEGAGGLPALAEAGDEDDATASRHGLRASAVLVARLRQEHLRARAFYPGPQSLTMAAQERPRGRRGGVDDSRLEQTARVQARWHALALPGLQLPEVVDVGADRRAAWVVERMLDGAGMTRAAWRERNGDLVRTLVAGHTALGLERVDGRDILVADAGARLRAAWEDEALGVGDVLRRSGHAAGPVVGALERLQARGPALVTAQCHGDPVAGNVLRGVNGDLILLDWEMAGRRPLVHDVLKVLWGQPDQAGAFLAVSTTCRASPPGPGTTALAPAGGARPGRGAGRLAGPVAGGRPFRPGTATPGPGAGAGPRPGAAHRRLTARMTATPVRAGMSDGQRETTRSCSSGSTRCASAGLPPLLREAAMHAVAQRWTATVASDRDLAHTLSSSGQTPSGWTRASKNLAPGGSPAQVHQMWMDSSGHPVEGLHRYHTRIAEGSVAGLGTHHRMDVVVTRCSDNHGPYQSPEKVTPRFATHLLDGLTVPPQPRRRRTSRDTVTIARTGRRPSSRS